MALTKATQVGAHLAGDTFVSLEFMDAVGDGIADDTDVVKQALAHAASTGTCKVIGGRKYKIRQDEIIIPSNVTLVGTFIADITITNADHFLFKMQGSNSHIADSTINLRMNGQGDVSHVLLAVHMDTSSKYCSVRNTLIDGRYEESAMGFIHGVRQLGRANTVANCTILRCSMGVTRRGMFNRVTGCYIDNQFLQEGPKPWSHSSMYWDGIVMEGDVYGEISGNLVMYNGQSGIYMGGNNSLSYGTRIVNNTVCWNWNRGIDTGISGTPNSATNDVRELNISANILRDNRETQLWMYGTNRSKVADNSITETAEYGVLYAGYESTTRAGIALGHAWCVNNSITDNRIEVQATTPFSVVWNGTGHTITSNKVSGGATAYIFGNDAGRLYQNRVDLYQGTFTPALVSAPGVTLTSSSGTYSIRDHVITFEIKLTFGMSAPSGGITIGYLPGMSAANPTMRNLTVTAASGWKAALADKTVVATPAASKDQFTLGVFGNGNTSVDMSAYVDTGSSLTISGRYEVTPA